MYMPRLLVHLRINFKQAHIIDVLKTRETVVNARFLLMNVRYVNLPLLEIAESMFLEMT